MTWISLSTGKKLDFVTPDPESLTLDNIVRSLSRTGRWANQTRDFFSVAQHSVLVSQYVEARGGSRHEQLVAMLHDAPEAYTGDAARPFKRLLGESFKGIEQRLWEAISLKFLGELAEMSLLVKHCDNLALATEARDLFDIAPTFECDYSLPDPDGRPIVPWSMQQAFAVFKARYNKLSYGIPENAPV